MARIGLNEISPVERRVVEMETLPAGLCLVNLDIFYFQILVCGPHVPSHFYYSEMDISSIFVFTRTPIWT